jgi:glycosyltransferase involved in cell wall biosynthesis
MKILQINKFFYRKGGAEALFLDLIDLLEANGHEVISFSMKDAKNQPSKYADYFVDAVDFNIKEGIARDLKKAGHLIYSVEAKNKLEKLILATKPDIAHLHNIAHQISPSIISVLKKHKIPIVQTLHDYEIICPNYKLFTEGAPCERCKIHKYHEAIIHRCLKNSYSFSALAALELSVHKLIRVYDKVNQFIAPSKFLANKIISWNIPEKKLIQLYNFLDAKEYKPNFEPGEYIVYFGRLERDKGIMTLVAALKDLPNIKLKILGDGELMEEIKNKKLNNIELVGYKKKEELKEIVSQSRFAILPSEIYENNPISVLEAFALGKPVIGAKSGGIPELVRDNKTGFIFEPGDAQDLQEKISYLYDKREKIIEMGRAGRRLVEEEFSPQIHYQKLIEIYKNLLEKRR